MPVKIERKGHRLKIVLEEKRSKFDNLKRRNCIVGDPDELIDLEVGEWIYSFTDVCLICAF
jgi:hypothetical protein